MSDTPQKKAARKQILLYISGVGMGVASELAALVAFGMYLGRYLDKHWNLAPYGTMGCVLLFLGAGLIHIVLILIKMQKKLESLKEDSDKPDL